MVCPEGWSPPPASCLCRSHSTSGLASLIQGLLKQDNLSSLGKIWGELGWDVLQGRQRSDCLVTYCLLPISSLPEVHISLWHRSASLAGTCQGGWGLPSLSQSTLHGACGAPTAQPAPCPWLLRPWGRPGPRAPFTAHGTLLVLRGQPSGRPLVGRMPTPTHPDL